MALENLTIDVKFKVNNKTLNNLDKQLDKISSNSKKSFGKAEKSVQKVVNTGSKLSRVFQKSSNSADTLQKKISNVGKAMKNVGTTGNKGFGSITGSVFKGNLALQVFNGSLQAIKSSISGIVRLSDKWTNTTARLNLLTGGNAVATGKLKDSIYAAAQRSRGDFGATSDTVAKLGLLAGDSFKDNDELVRFTELLNKQFAIAGADEMQKSSGLLQLSQAMASGRLQGDEFRSIMENAPLLADAIAKYTGKSKGELKEMSKEGTITSDVIKNALFASSGDINKQFESMPMTFSSAWTKIRNQAEYGSQGLLTQLNGVLNSDFGRGAIDGISSSINSLIGGIEKAIVRISEFGSWIGEKISPYTDKFKTGFGEMKADLSVFWSSVQPILTQWKDNFAGIFEKAIPLLERLWNQVLVPFVDWFVNVLWPVIKPIIEGIGNAFKSQFDGILQAIDGVITALSGVIDFLTGVFTGDWQLAWDGIKGIFSGVWDGLKGIAKGALNGVIDMVNGFFGSLNVQIPNWIPEKFGGGKTFSLPKIPNFATGTNSTPDTFIAGEQGPELITNAPNRKVYTADETQDILSGGTVYNNTFTFNITGNNSREIADEVRATMEDIFSSIGRKNPRLREV